MGTLNQQRGAKCIVFTDGHINGWYKKKVHLLGIGVFFFAHAWHYSAKYRVDNKDSRTNQSGGSWLECNAEDGRGSSWDRMGKVLLLKIPIGYVFLFNLLNVHSIIEKASKKMEK